MSRVNEQDTSDFSQKASSLDLWTEELNLQLVVEWDGLLGQVSELLILRKSSTHKERVHQVVGLLRKHDALNIECTCTDAAVSPVTARHDLGDR